MKLAKATDYAVRALVAIGRRGEAGPAGMEALTRETGAPAAFLGKVLQRLKRAGLLRGVHGPGGGYGLAVPAEEITVRDVVEAVEGGTALTACVSREEKCPRARRCATRPLWSRLQARLNAALESETIGALARRAGGGKRVGRGKRRRRTG